MIQRSGNINCHIPLKKDTIIKYSPYIIIRYEKDSGNYLRTCALRSACSGSRVHATRKDHRNTNANNGGNLRSGYPISNINCRFFDAGAYPDPAFLLGYRDTGPE
jgi:hypothetical protein